MTREVVYVDSGEEQVAWLVARYGPQGTWSTRDQGLVTLEDGSLAERATLRTSRGDIEVEFRDAAPQVISFTEALAAQRAAWQALWQRVPIAAPG